jgi:hypothetical protein
MTDSLSKQLQGGESVWITKAIREREPHKATSLARMAAEILFYSQMLPTKQHGAHMMHHSNSELLALACEEYLNLYNRTKKKINN